MFIFENEYERTDTHFDIQHGSLKGQKGWLYASAKTIKRLEPPDALAGCPLKKPSWSCNVSPEKADIFWILSLHSIYTTWLEMSPKHIPLWAFKEI